MNRNFFNNISFSLFLAIILYLLYRELRFDIGLVSLVISGLISFEISNLFVSSELLINIDTYIEVHNYIHFKESSILLSMSNLFNNKRGSQPLTAYPLSLPLGVKGKGASRLREERGRFYNLKEYRYIKLISTNSNSNSYKKAFKDHYFNLFLSNELLENYTGISEYERDLVKVLKIEWQNLVSESIKLNKQKKKTDELWKAIKNGPSNFNYIKSSYTLRSEEIEKVQCLSEMGSIKKALALNYNEKQKLKHTLYKIYIRSPLINLGFHNTEKLDKLRIKYDTETDVSIVASFSGVNNIKDKNITREYYKKTKNFPIDLTQEEFLREGLEERRSAYYSTIASTIFISSSRINALNSMLLTPNENDKLINFFLKLISIGITKLFFINTLEPFLIRTFVFPNGKKFSLVFATLENISIFLGEKVRDIRGNKELNYGDEGMFDRFSKFSIKNIITESIFIFGGQKWSSIVNEFKKRGIHISSGNSVKRHIVSPMDYKLSLFMSNFSNKGYNEIVKSFNFIKKELYESVEKSGGIQKLNSENKRIDLNKISLTNEEGLTFQEIYDKLELKNPLIEVIFYIGIKGGIYTKKAEAEAEVETVPVARDFDSKSP